MLLEDKELERLEPSKQSLMVSIASLMSRSTQNKKTNGILNLVAALVLLNSDDTSGTLTSAARRLISNYTNK